MNVKEYLAQLQEFEQKIEEQERFIQDLRDSLTSADYSLKPDKVQSSVSNDGIERIVTKIVDAEKDLKKLKEKTAIFRVQVIEQIHEMKDMILKNLLNLKYIHWKENPTLADVAKAMGYSEDHVKKLHRKALVEFGLMLVNLTPNDT